MRPVLDGQGNTLAGHGWDSDCDQLLNAENSSSKQWQWTQHAVSLWEHRVARPAYAHNKQQADVNTLWN